MVDLSPSPELPLPEIAITVHSSAGSGKENCLRVDLPKDTDSLMCEVGVVSNLVAMPAIRWMKGPSELVSNIGSMLMYELTPNEEGTFTCKACITVDAADIRDYCSERAVEITREG